MKIFKKHITEMKAYTPPLEGRNKADYTLLDFNERTVPVSNEVKQALIDFINNDSLQQYPAYGDLTEQIAAYCHVNSDQVMITNGSDQGIDLIFRAACQAGDEVIVPSPGFAMYSQCAGIENLKLVQPHYSRVNGFPVDEVLGAISPATRLIVISNPNNPCGTLIPAETILRIARAAPDTAVMVDECYFEYSQVTVADCLSSHPNLLITRTFSKTWGLPTIRLGYVLSAAENIRALLNIRGPYDINQFAVVAARVALENPEYMRDYVHEVMQQSKPLLEQFLDERQISYWASGANYLWLFPEHPQSVNEQLQKNGILVRPKADIDGNLGLRVTVGTLTQTRHLIDILKNVV